MKSYSEDPGHYKALISKINTEIDFPGYLGAMGYRLIKRSAGSSEFEKDGDRIVLQTKRIPVTYFNRSDSLDKGRFFTFLKRRSDNFYEAVRQGLDSIERSYEIVGPTAVKKRPAPTQSLEEKYHIGPLSRWDYLIKERSLDQATFQSEAFKGRIFNAFHVNDNKGRIANIAVPKYGVDGIVKNYTLYNRPYTDRRDGKTKKFRLFLNERYQYLFVSNPDIKAQKIVCFESAFDALAYHELHKRPNCFYISLSGHIDDRKLDQLFQWKALVDPHDNLPLHLGFDSDMEGMRYDLRLLSAWMKRKSKDVFMEVVWKRPVAEIRLNYRSGQHGQMERDSERLNARIAERFQGHPLGMKKALCFKDKVIWEMDLQRILDMGDNTLISRAYWKTAVRALSGLCTGNKIHMAKPKMGKDWNDELILVKKKCVRWPRQKSKRWSKVLQENK